MVDRQFWNKKQVFVTGHTGFKGGWLSAWLLEMGAEVSGYALKPDTDPCFFHLCGLGDRVRSVIADIRDANALKRAIQESQPEIVFHLAAQPLVRRSYQDPVETFSTNVMGTVNLLDAVRRAPSVRAVIVVTSDKCYESKDTDGGYKEDDPMGGHDPYSASKGCAELVTTAYRRSYFADTSSPVAVASVRAGNVIGGGDWGEDRLVPDAVRALQQNQPLVVRNPEAVRPWQHVLEPLAGYLMLAERLYREKDPWAGAWNFGPRVQDAVPVATLANMVFRLWGKGGWQTDTDQNQPHETQYLALDSSKARHTLGWRPQLSLEEAVGLTVSWYLQAVSVEPRHDMYKATAGQIADYESRLKTLPHE